AFRSEATNQYMVSITVPIWNTADAADPNRKVIGVLGRTTHLSQLLHDYDRSIRGEDRTQNVNRIIALVDRRDWQILAHDWITKENLEQFQTHELHGVFDQLTLDDATTGKLDRLQSRDGTAAKIDSDGFEHHYRDPAARLDQRYAGDWLAAFAPIGDTGWTVIVQERRQAALQPVDDMQHSLTRTGLWALAVGGGLILLFWYFVNRALSDRSVRLWTTRRGPARTNGSTTSLSDQ
ncbi:MAG: cache domain-containing protein, partial [Planctomycetaceae bacterium]